MGYQPFLIAPYKSGLSTDEEPWLIPPDAFNSIVNGRIHHGVIGKREGYRFLAQMRYDGPVFATNRIMGIFRFIKSDNSKTTVIFDTNRAGTYNAATNLIDPVDTADIFTSTDIDYVWAANWQSTALTNRLYFTNGVAFNGTEDGIRYYDGTATTTSFVPDLNTKMTRKLYGGKLLFVVKQRLVVLHTFENDSGGGGTSAFPQRARWCQAQGPSNWNDIVPGGGGFVDAPTGEQIISARQLQDVIIVFFTDSVWTLRPVSDPALPFRWDKINSFRACDGKMATIGYDRYVVAFGVRGITMTDGVETKRIDHRIQDFVSDEINTDEFDKTYCERSYANTRMWTLYSGELDGDTADNDADRALIYDDDSSSWSIYDIGMNVLGHGNAGQDYGLDDFVASNDLDVDLLGVGDDTLQDYFFQKNQELFLGGDRSGNVYILEEGSDDDGDGIGFSLQSAYWNPFKDQGVEVQFGYIDFYVDTDKSTVFEVQFLKNDNPTPVQSKLVYCIPDLREISTVVGATNANPASVSIPNHGLTTGNIIYIYGVQGMINLNGGPYTVTVVDVDTVTLDGIDSTAFSAYTTGGVAVENEFYRTKVWGRAYCGEIGYQHQIKITSPESSNPFEIHAYKLYMRPRGKRTIG